MAFGGNRGNGPISEINVTPLVDVMLVLLVIFMITAPLMFNGIELTLPKTQESNAINLTSDQVVLSFTGSGEFYIGKDKVLKTELIDILGQRFSSTANKVLFLRADYKIEYGRVAKLMSFLKANNFNNIALVTEVDDKK